ncbi:hypothetical protein HELRODRAFT_89643 [Helobdella robusta]|uniref:Clusterin-associated protein 1 n=1 Tax=Helobdella robusta TaxID=6412 RepID=T1G7F4_HELRO|nr:hypothetical protein HELRODRAFT_89643 [Helobdella robusta]ESN92313.1 hypothetical protein HELRODRAFT_89643 [Helobdella robusta]
MSYRDMRNFTEMMRALGYKRLISMENFKKPVFPLMADIMTWLALRFEPNADIPRDIESQQDRIIFIKYITEFMATKVSTKVNPKKLYESDGYSVKEMIKVSQILYQAMLSSADGDGANGDGHDDDDDGITALSVMSDLSSKVHELKEARLMTSELIRKGALLHDLLAKEVDLKLARLNALSKQLELGDVERLLAESEKSVQTELAKIMSLIESIASDEANLEAKIEKKRAELERNKKRYESLQGVRPAYMDEFERCEEELQQMFSEYLDKQKNSSFLELIYEKYNKIEQDFSAVRSSHNWVNSVNVVTGVSESDKKYPTPVPQKIRFRFQIIIFDSSP